MNEKLKTAIGYALAELSRAYYAADKIGDQDTKEATARAYERLSNASDHETPRATREAKGFHTVPPKH